MNIAIIIHLYHTYLYDEFLGYINNVKQVFKNVTVIITINDSNFKNVIHKKNPEFIVIILENKGVDVYAFIKSILYLRQNNIHIDYILKLHTKISSCVKEDLINWRKDLIKPLVTNYNLALFKHYFTTMENLGCISSQKCVFPRNFDYFYYPQIIDGVQILISRFPHLEKNWTEFNGGNMIWINDKVLYKYLTDDLIDFLFKQFHNGKPPNDDSISYEYICERIFTGLFCYDTTNILVNEYNGTVTGYNRSYPNQICYQPKTINFYKPKELYETLHI